MPFVVLEVETDPDTVTEDQIDFIKSIIPDWEPAAGNLDYILLQANAQEASIQRFQLQEMSEAALRAFGPLAGISANDPTTAAGTTTWSLLDTDGHVIPADTQIALTGLDGEPVAFRTIDDTTVDAGQSQATGVEIEAVEEGSAGSGLSGEAELLDGLAFVDTVTAEGVTTSGIDGETDAEYLDRLSNRLQLQADRVILPRDFELMAREVTGVYRAVAIDGYDPNTQTYDNERAVTVAIVDESGEALPTPTKNEVDALLKSKREVNFLVYVIDATYTNIDVTVEVVTLPEFDVDNVQTQVEAALNDYLSPASWGKNPTGGDERDWINTTLVRYLEIAEAINRAEGVHYIVEDTLLIEGLVEQDIALTGPAPLTRSGTITVTVHSYDYS